MAQKKSNKKAKSKKKSTTPIRQTIQREVLKPSCYDRFSCKGGDCRTNCCQGWNIQMTKKEYQALLKKKFSASSLVSAVSSDNHKGLYEVRLDENHSCPFLTDSALCSLQATFGPGILSNTCQTYPRIYHQHLDKMELGLSLGCEKVLELLLEEQDGLQFSNNMESFALGHKPNSFLDQTAITNHPVLNYYYDIQSLFLGIIQAKDASIEDRLILLGIALFRIDQLVSDQKTEEIPSYIAGYLNSLESSDIVDQLKDIKAEHPGALYANLIMGKQAINEHAHHYRLLMDRVSEKLKIQMTSSESQNPDSDVQYTSECSPEDYSFYREQFTLFTKDNEYFLENLLVGFMFQLNVPFKNLDHGIWNNYLYYVWAYSMVKFVLTVLLDDNSTKEEMINYCSIMFRSLGHNDSLIERVIEQFNKSQSSSVSHLAVLLKSI